MQATTVYGRDGKEALNKHQAGTPNYAFPVILAPVAHKLKKQLPSSEGGFAA